MGIINAYDTSRPLITPDLLYEKNDICDICIVTFSINVLNNVLENYNYEIAAKASYANGEIPIYYLSDYDVLFYMSPIGSAVASTTMQEVQFITGARSFIVFGSCGIIDRSAENKIIVPMEAYREEGFSYHYVKADRYIKIRNAEKVKEILDNNDIDNITGKTWTTDAIYMETINKANMRKQEGCICVEMEASGLQAICDYLKMDLYIFFFSGDILSHTWERADLGGEKEKHKQLNCFEIALLLLSELRKGQHGN